MRAVGASLSIAFLVAVPAFPSELVLGTVRIGLGTPEAPLVAELEKEFVVRSIRGGWEVRPPPSQKAGGPLVGIATKAGVVTGVTFRWGPGVTPELEEMTRQLAHALPAHGSCRIENATQPFEGGTVRTLLFRCEGTTVRMVTGEWPQGNTASIVVGEN